MTASKTKTVLKFQSTVLAITLTVSGCAGVSPYVTPNKSITDSVLTGDNPAARVNNSLNFTIAQAGAWRNRANRTATGQNLLYGAALPASAVAAYYGITGDRGTSAITALSVGSTGLFGWGLLNQSRPRQQIYLSGMDALTCVIWSAAPLAMPASEYNALEKAAGEVSAAMSEVVSNRGKVRTGFATLREFAGDDLTARAALDRIESETLSEPNAAVTKAETALTGVYKLRASMDAAGTQILANTMAIEAVVNEQLRTMEPTPQAVLQIAQEFNTSARALSKRFSYTPPVPPSETKAGADPAMLGELQGLRSGQVQTMQAYSTALQSLAESGGKLEAKTAKLTAMINGRADALAAAGNIKMCKAANAVQPLRVTPATTPVALPEGGAYNLELSGGSGVYHVKMVGKSQADVKVTYEGSPFPSRQPVITFPSNTKGTYTAAIYDSNRPDTPPELIIFNLGQAAPANKSNFSTFRFPGASTWRVVNRNDKQAASCRDLSDTQVAIAQLAFLGEGVVENTVGFVDGTWGARTDKAAAKYLYNKKWPKNPAQSVECGFDVFMQTMPQMRNLVLDGALAMKQDGLVDGAYTSTGRQAVRSCGTHALTYCWYREQQARQ